MTELIKTSITIMHLAKRTLSRPKRFRSVYTFLRPVTDRIRKLLGASSSGQSMARRWKPQNSEIPRAAQTSPHAGRLCKVKQQRLAAAAARALRFAVRARDHSNSTRFRVHGAHTYTSTSAVREPTRVALIITVAE